MLHAASETLEAPDRRRFQYCFLNRTITSTTRAEGGMRGIWNRVRRQSNVFTDADWQLLFKMLQLIDRDLTDLAHNLTITPEVFVELEAIFKFIEKSHKLPLYFKHVKQEYNAPSGWGWLSVAAGKAINPSKKSFKLAYENKIFSLNTFTKYIACAVYHEDDAALSYAFHCEISEPQASIRKHALFHEMCLQFGKEPLYKKHKQYLAEMLDLQKAYYGRNWNHSLQFFIRTRPDLFKFVQFIKLLDTANGHKQHSASKWLQLLHNENELDDVLLQNLNLSDEACQMQILQKLAGCVPFQVFKLIVQHPLFAKNFSDNFDILLSHFMHSNRWGDACLFLAIPGVVEKARFWVLESRSTRFVIDKRTHLKNFILFFNLLLGGDYPKLRAPFVAPNQHPNFNAIAENVIDTLFDKKSVQNDFLLEFKRMDRLKILAKSFEEKVLDSTDSYERKLPVLEGLFGEALDTLSVEAVERDIKRLILTLMKASGAHPEFFDDEDVIKKYIRGHNKTLKKARALFQNQEDIFETALRAYDPESLTEEYPNYFTGKAKRRESIGNEFAESVLVPLSQDDINGSRAVRRYSALVFLACKGKPALQNDYVYALKDLRRGNNATGKMWPDRPSCLKYTLNHLGHALTKHEHPVLSETSTRRQRLEQVLSQVACNAFKAELIACSTAAKRTKLYTALVYFSENNRASVLKGERQYAIDGEHFVYTKDYLKLRAKFLNSLTTDLMEKIDVILLNQSVSPVEYKEETLGEDIIVLSALAQFGDQNGQLSSVYSNVMGAVHAVKKDLNKNREIAASAGVSASTSSAAIMSEESAEAAIVFAPYSEEVVFTPVNQAEATSYANDENDPLDHEVMRGLFSLKARY